MNPVRVLRVINDLDAGGAQHLLLQYARHHDRTQFALQVASFRDGVLAGELAALGIPRHIVPRRGRYDISLVPRLQRLMRATGAHLVHAQLTAAKIWARAAAHRERLPFIATEHALPPRFDHWRYRCLERLLRSPRDRYLTDSAALRETLVDRFGVSAARVSAFTPAYEPARVRSERSREAARARFGLTGGQAAGLVIGRLAPQKGIDILLDALTPAQGESGFRLLVFGDGPQRAPLAAQAEQRGLTPFIIWLGGVGSPADALAAADLFLFPSRWEGFPVALLEAAAVGLPVIASPLDGCREFAQEYPGTTLVRENSPAVWCTAITEYLTTPRPRQQSLRGHEAPAMAHALEDRYRQELAEQAYG